MWDKWEFPYGPFSKKQTFFPAAGPFFQTESLKQLKRVSERAQARNLTKLGASLVWEEWRLSDWQQFQTNVSFPPPKTVSSQVQASGYRKPLAERGNVAQQQPSARQVAINQ